MIDVYCLPGTMCDERLWQRVLDFLPDNIRLIHIDIPEENVLDRMVAALVDSLPKEPFHVIGFSLGGYLVSELARVVPERLLSAVMVSNVGTALPESEKAQRVQALNWVKKVGYKGIPKKKAMAMLAPDHREDGSLLECIKAMDEALGEPALLAQLEATLERRENCDAIKASGCDWLVLAGRYDQFVSPQAMARLNALENVTIHSVSNCGHMLPLEQPKWMAKKLEQFLLAK